MVRHDGGLRGDKTASHLSDIGFNPMDQEEWKALVRHAAKSGEPLESRKGTHIRWSPGHGIELWVQVRLSQKKPELIGCVPHFPKLRGPVTASKRCITSRRATPNRME